MHEREHLLVSPDHGEDDGSLKLLEFLIIHLEGWLHLTDRRVSLVLRQDGEVIAELAHRERFVHLLQRTIGLIEERLRVGHKCFGNGAHVQAPPSRWGDRSFERHQIERSVAAERCRPSPPPGILPQ